jgi:hypothetical protein
MARRRGLHATAGLRSLIAILYFLNLTTAYQYVQNSPCEPQCRDGTLSEDAVCLDAQYRTTDGGKRLQSCVGCLLNSTAVDTGKNQSDVEWGLCSYSPVAYISTLLTQSQLRSATRYRHACSASRLSASRFRVHVKSPANR